jgi:PAS domain S-box-containing protein
LPKHDTRRFVPHRNEDACSLITQVLEKMMQPDFRPDNYFSPKRGHYQSARWLLVVLTGAVFLIELLVLLLSGVLPSMPRIARYLLDSTLSAVLIFPIFYFLVFRPLLKNITKLEQAEENLRIVSVAFESKDPILITDANINILRANNMFLKITGYTMEEIIGKNPRIFKSGLYRLDFYKQMWKQLLHAGSWSGEIRIRDNNGQEIPAGIVITAIKNEQQETTHFVAIYNL